MFEVLSACKMLNNESKYDQTKSNSPTNHDQSNINSNKLNSFGQQLADKTHFMDSNLLSGKHFLFNPTGTETFTTSEGRDPSIKIFTSYPSSLEGLHSGVLIPSKTNSGGSDEKRSFDDSGTTSSFPNNQFTPGKMPEQFQERILTDVKSRLVANTPIRAPIFSSNGDNGDDYDEEEDDSIQLPSGNESTGRWTRNEHEMFLEALKKYGKVHFM